MKENNKHVCVGLFVVLLLAIMSPFLAAIGYSNYSGLTIRMQSLLWYFDNQLNHIRFGFIGLWEMV
jgi:hypothetical protein